MSDPKEQAPKDDLDLDTETVQDLEPSEENAEDVRGGYKATGLSACKACA